MTKRPSEAELKEQYKEAWEEWYASGDAELLDSVTGDGLGTPEEEEAQEAALERALESENTEGR
ncbi:hypothetical protein [Glycomyces buryatensis]|uniref:Uncharacterized protein n=1 Tax=Glycomyces buryatensis TaxID=2570927 RepID=A0A4S8PVP6_9ACTN|nr:hypothetical protein [Glycomyces buryatensis]THV35640.1 hypothetical protein FAB82_22455 [Glycomyces buryatensis]